MLRHDTKIIHAQDLKLELLKNYQIFNVRNVGECFNEFVKSAIFVPLEHLREHLGSGILDKNRKTLVYCQVRYRGCLAFEFWNKLGLS
jgi:rhodanese-related sulfurtransferase